MKVDNENLERERERERERLPMGRDFVGDLDGQSHRFPVA